MTSKDEAIKLAIQWFEWYLGFPGSDAEPAHPSTYVYKQLLDADRGSEK